MTLINVMVLSERPTTYKIIHFGASTIDLPIQLFSDIKKLINRIFRTVLKIYQQFTLLNNYAENLKHRCSYFFYNRFHLHQINLFPQIRDG